MKRWCLWQLELSVMGAKFRKREKNRGSGTVDYLNKLLSNLWGIHFWEFQPQNTFHRCFRNRAISVFLISTIQQWRLAIPSFHLCSTPICHTLSLLRLKMFMIYAVFVFTNWTTNRLHVTEAVGPMHVSPWQEGPCCKRPFLFLELLNSGL